MKGKKTSSEKIVEVITAKITNPDLSTRDIGEDTDLPHNTVSRIINEELEQVGTQEKKDELFDMNLEIIKEATQKVMSAMKSMTPEKISEAKEMQAIVDTAFKQNQLIQGKNTENIGFTGLTDEEKTHLRSLL